MSSTRSSIAPGDSVSASGSAVVVEEVCFPGVFPYESFLASGIPFEQWQGAMLAHNCLLRKYYAAVNPRNRSRGRRRRGVASRAVSQSSSLTNLTVQSAPIRLKLTEEQMAVAFAVAGVSGYGYCYLRVVVPECAKVAVGHCGVGPTLKELLLCPRAWFQPDEFLQGVGVTHLSDGTYHLGPFSGSDTNFLTLLRSVRGVEGLEGSLSSSLKVYRPATYPCTYGGVERVGFDREVSLVSFVAGTLGVDEGSLKAGGLSSEYRGCAASADAVRAAGAAAVVVDLAGRFPYAGGEFSRALALVNYRMTTIASFGLTPFSRLLREKYPDEGRDVLDAVMGCVLQVHGLVFVGRFAEAVDLYTGFPAAGSVSVSEPSVKIRWEELCYPTAVQELRKYGWTEVYSAEELWSKLSGFGSVRKRDKLIRCQDLWEIWGSKDVFRAGSH